MSSRSDVRVVVVTPTMRGVPEAIAAVPGVDAGEGPVDEVVGAEVLVTFQWRDEWLVPGLRWVQSVSTGVEQFPADWLSEAGVVLTSARGVHGPQMSEHVFGLLFGLTRGIAVSVRRQQEHLWKGTRLDEMSGRTMGILGMGSIGEALAERARAFGMQVIGVKRSPEGEGLFGPEDVVEVCRRSDVVVSLLPGGSATEHLMGREAFEALGAGWFVSVGRGSAVDQAALTEALTEGKLSGAGLDVFEEEPLPDDSPLWDLPNVTITPHCGGVSPRYGERLAGIFEQNLAALRGEGEWLNRVV